MLSVVIPAHNEDGNLPELLQEVHRALQGHIDYEIIVVDDGSTDQTGPVLTQLSQQLPMLRVVRHRHCCGQSTSLMSGVDAARGALVATLDGDGQNDPADLPRMLELLRTSAAPQTMIVGHRTRRRDSAWRRLCSRVANMVRASLLRDATPDSGCGIKLFQRESFQKFPRFDHMHRFLPALQRRAGGEVLSMPVHHRPRGSGRSHYGTLGRLLAGIVDLAGVAWLMWRYQRPELDNRNGVSAAEC